MARDRWWTLPLRAALAAMWIVHGLEKFGVRWPVVLGGGTHSVADMLGLMAGETPFGPLRWLIEGVLLPMAGWLQYPVGVLEIGLGLALATGALLTPATLLGAGMQTFFWLGFFTLDWPPQYPLVILAHLALAAPRLLRQADWTADHWLLPLRLAAGTVWIYEGSGGSPWLLAAGALMLAGMGVRALALVALILTVQAFRTEAWGFWPWSYYLVAAAHLALLAGARGVGPAAARWLPERLRPWAA